MWLKIWIFWQYCCRSRDFSLVLQTVSWVPCHQSIEFLDDFLWNFYSKWVIYEQSSFICMSLHYCSACLWLWNVYWYDEIVPCSVTSDMTPFSSWMPITKFFNIFFVPQILRPYPRVYQFRKCYTRSL